MDSNYKAYDHVSSFNRISNYLSASSSNYEEVKELPDRDKLTFTNGYYADCSALFVDIRNSSNLPTYYRRPALAKLYRAYISETVAIINSCTTTREVNIVGDGVWAVFNTRYQHNIDEVFSIAAMINSMIKVWNYKLQKAGYTYAPHLAGIGLDYGRALMIKAGYSGSGINEVVYMGDVVNHAAKLAAKASKDGTPPIFIGEVFGNNLNEDNQKLLTNVLFTDYYTTNAVNTDMNEWYIENCT